MNEERRKALSGHIGWGFVVSLLLHLSWVLPMVLLSVIFAREQAALRENEVELRFEDVKTSELPDNLPSLEPEKKKKARLAQSAEPEVPLPDNLPRLPEQEPAPVPPPPQPEPRPEARKMVDLDNDKEVEPPPNARYLAQRNSRAEQETRATNTNLEREQKGDNAAPSDDEDKTAALDDQRSKLGRRAPAETPKLDPELEKNEAEKQKSLLALRNATKRAHEVTPETADPSLPRDPDGMRAMPLDRPEAVRDLPPPEGSAKRSRLSMTSKQYEYVFGDDADATVRLAQKEKSKRKGRFSQRMGQIQSALENFIPEVRPGNQTALNTRAAPFAAFIARMHRSIHALWGFGFLEDLEQKPASNPFNNPDLLTKLEIILNRDGTVSKVTVARSSGFLPYDVAAIDTVYSAAPFAEPPREIRSGNGKIYIHWSFHRDARQCATSGVDYYILDNPPADADKGDDGQTQVGIPTPGPRQGGPKRLQRELDEAAGGAEHTHKNQGTPEPDPTVARRAAAQVVRADDPEARNTAELWLDGYARGDVRRMLQQSTFPFRSSGGIAAKNTDDLGDLLRALLEESPPNRKVRALQLYSAAGARGSLGGLPPGFEEGTGMLFGIARVGGDTFVLVLAKRNGTWKAIGLVRR